MGNSAPQRDARSLREILAGLDRVAQHRAAAKWAVENGRSIDMPVCALKKRIICRNMEDF